MPSKSTMHRAASLSNAPEELPPQPPRTTRAYWLAQILSWAGVALAHLGLVALLIGLDWPAVVFYSEAAALGLLLSHGLVVLAERRSWSLLRVARWLPRTLAASAVGGVLLVSVVVLTVRALQSLLALSESGREEMMLLGDPGRVAGLVIYWGGILFVWQLSYYAYLLVHRLRRSEVERWQLEAAVNDAELRALKAQLDPHFIFNCLNSIRALVTEDPARAREMITRLAGILRSTLGSGDAAVVPLRRELEMVQNYLALEAIRFEDRLDVRLDVPEETLDLELPPMVLQHLVENAIKHGVGERRGPGRLTVAARRDSRHLTIEVVNEGDLSPLSEGGFGLRKSLERLRLIYGDDASLHLSVPAAGTVRSELRVPVEEPS